VSRTKTGFKREIKMGIVVCISMLLGLSVLQPIPWNRSGRAQHEPLFVLFVAIVLCGLGLWNVLYGIFNASGFWMWASLISGTAMMLGSFYIFSEQNAGFDTDGDSEINTSGMRKAIVAILVLSFLVYAVTLVQLNLGYSIIR